MGRATAKRHYGKTRTAVATVARERVDILIGQARQMALKNEKLSRRYVEMARRISERTKVKIPREVKTYLCKGCGIAMVLGHNARLRVHAGNSGIVITCLSCGAVKRYPVSPKLEVKARIAINPYISQTEPYPKKHPVKD